MAALRTVRLSPLAEGDLEDIWLYTFQHWSAAQADKYHNAIVAVFADLERGKKGRPSDIRDGYFKLPAGSHIIYYRDDPAARTVDVIRILHQRMDAQRHL